MNPTLHVITHPDGLPAALPAIRSGDLLLLIEDGVYLLERDPASLSALQQRQCSLHVLATDQQARGIPAPSDPAATLVDDAGFVELVAACSQALSW